MNTTLKVNSRGTVTLPKALRNVLGVVNGGTLMYTFRDGDVVLQPAMTYPIEIYTDERIAEFQEDEEAMGILLDKFHEKKGWEYDPKTWSIREKKTPYRAKKKKA